MYLELNKAEVEEIIDGLECVCTNRCASSEERTEVKNLIVCIQRQIDGQTDTSVKGFMA